MQIELGLTDWEPSTLAPKGLLYYSIPPQLMLKAPQTAIKSHKEGDIYMVSSWWRDATGILVCWMY